MLMMLRASVYSLLFALRERRRLKKVNLPATGISLLEETAVGSAVEDARWMQPNKWEDATNLGEIKDSRR